MCVQPTFILNHLHRPSASEGKLVSEGLQRRARNSEHRGLAGYADYVYQSGAHGIAPSPRAPGKL
jgi:hypothetical protein